MQVYLWDRRFLLRAASFVVPRAAKPHKRLSITVLVARARPFAMEGVGVPGQRFQGVMLAPNVPRLSLEAPDAELTLLDAGITTAAYRRLQGCIAPGQARALTAGELARLAPVLDRVAGRELDPADAATHYGALLAALAGDTPAAAVVVDARVLRVMQLIDELPLDALSMTRLARAAGVSPSRLRALFQQQFGCAPAQYTRWAGAWKAIRRWRKGLRLTDVALDAGFHDLSHIDHAVKELFGLNPSAIALARGVSLHQCED